MEGIAKIIGGLQVLPIFGDNDRFKISFGPGQKTTFSVEIGASNKNLQIDYPRNSGAFVPVNNTISGFVAQENTVEDGGVIRVADVDEKSKSTQLTVHVETSSIGKVSNIQFSPKFFDTNVKIDDTGNQISLKAVGIETFEGLSIDSPEGPISFK